MLARSRQMGEKKRKKTGYPWAAANQIAEAA
jgi:hypothetical protein